MELSVPCNWDYGLLDQFIPGITEIYGSTNINVFGSGRPAYIIRNINLKEMTRYISLVHQKGIKFNYTMNAPCLNNAEFEKKGHKKLLRYLEQLVEAGIDGVTVTIPFLVELIKKRFPRLYVKVSVIAHVNSVRKARLFEDLGADEIMVDYMMNRDFVTLENIRNSVKARLSLLLNDACLYDCIHRCSHYNTIGHTSQLGHSSKGYFLGYSALCCSIDRLKNPALIISSRWIRPEDLKHYENLGYDKFKISGRKMTSLWILNTANAYISRDYQGNLVDLLDYPLPGTHEGSMPLQQSIFRQGVRKLNSRNLRQLRNFNPRKPVIDNKALEGVLDYFLQGKCSGICSECSHCEDFAEKAVMRDEQETERILTLFSAIKEEIVTSRLFGCNDSGRSVQK